MSPIKFYCLLCKSNRSSIAFYSCLPIEVQLLSIPAWNDKQPNTEIRFHLLLLRLHFHIHHLLLLHLMLMLPPFLLLLQLLLLATVASVIAVAPAAAWKIRIDLSSIDSNDVLCLIQLLVLIWHIRHPYSHRTIYLKSVVLSLC